MLGLSTTYLLPAILLNPAFILHLINTFVSRVVSPSPAAPSHSPHPFMESIGPLPGHSPYWDVHADDSLCWSYTVVMVIVQVLAFGRVQDNRVASRERRAAAKERRKIENEAAPEERKIEAIARVEANEMGIDGAQDSLVPSEGEISTWTVESAKRNEPVIINGHGSMRRKPAKSASILTKKESVLTLTGTLRWFSQKTKGLKPITTSPAPRMTPKEIRTQMVEVESRHSLTSSDERII